MKGDFTRKTFDPLNHFARVLMQQGRVQLDADWNEQTAILLHYLRALGADLIGPHGGPADAPGAVTPGKTGFAISPLVTGAGAVSGDFVIGAGHYYVDGILCEAGGTGVPITALNAQKKQATVLFWPQDGLMPRKDQDLYVELFDAASPATTVQPLRARIVEAQPAQHMLTLDVDPGPISGFLRPRLRRLATYLTQPDYPAGAQDLKTDATYLVYLDVWERLITCAEDDAIREVALGGPDTAARSKIVWQVKLQKGTLSEGGTTPCERFTPAFAAISSRAGRGWLKAMAKQEPVSTDPCVIAPSARYRGPENQLYRVEIHRAGVADANPATGATFKWSRENGCVVYPIVDGGGTNVVAVQTLGRDDRFGLVDGANGDFVEIVDDDSALCNVANDLLRVKAIDRTQLTVTLEGVPPPGVGHELSKHPLLRRWDHKPGDPTEGGLQLGSDNAALIVEGVWLDLEDGVQIQFTKLTADGGKQNRYRTGDYWLIPARTATGDVEWPKEKDADGNLLKDGDGNLLPIPKEPDGVAHHHAPLAVITVNANGDVEVQQPTCQKTFGPAAAPPTTD